MHEVIAAAVDPMTALSVGLKVDAEALPPAVVDGIQNGSVDLDEPGDHRRAAEARTRWSASKGTVETVNGEDTLDARRHHLRAVPLDGRQLVRARHRQAARRLAQPRPEPRRDHRAVAGARRRRRRRVFNSWGKGKYDPRFNIDGLNKPVVIPPAYGLAGIHSITFTGDGDEIAYWNRYVAVTQMGGQGTFTEPRLNLSITNGTEDLVSSKLPALQAYQLSLAAPPPPAGSFDAAAAARGKLVFDGAGKCATCHSGAAVHRRQLRAASAGRLDGRAGDRRATRRARRPSSTAPRRCKGVWQHAPYFHDGSAATLEEVVQTYNSRRALGLSAAQMGDLAQYLKSL